ncbi:MAG: hypothetical protein AB7U75_21030 [Hyphomicrobiaceae bacterium]
MRAGGGASKGVSMVASSIGVSHVQKIDTPLGSTQILVPGTAAEMPQAADIIYRCVVRGENVFINDRNEIFSPMRFQQVVGKRMVMGMPL